VTGHVKVIHREWLQDGNRRFGLGCVCGWTAATSDGWDALAEFYAHAGYRFFGEAS
jgi:hypothetical protein